MRGDGLFVTSACDCVVQNNVFFINCHLSFLLRLFRHKKPVVVEWSASDLLQNSTTIQNSESTLVWYKTVNEAINDSLWWSRVENRRKRQGRKNESLSCLYIQKVHLTVFSRIKWVSNSWMDIVVRLKNSVDDGVNCHTTFGHHSQFTPQTFNKPILFYQYVTDGSDV